jgi:hypothetical protein
MQNEETKGNREGWSVQELADEASQQSIDEISAKLYAGMRRKAMPTSVTSPETSILTKPGKDARKLKTISAISRTRTVKEY